MTDETAIDYPGEEIDVRWDRELCIHIGECGKAEGGLFVGGRDPWCVPDKASRSQVRDVVERCPSGALSYHDKHGDPEAAPAENRVLVAYDGPLYVTGDLQIEGASAEAPGLRCRAALCRCGASRNKPFCDNSHREARFQDAGAIGERGPGLAEAGGPLRVTAIPDGPLRLEGNLSLQTASGRVAWKGTKAVLCRCGVSKNKPFCDGSHRAAGFSSD